jgi:hypothetical protein
MSILLAGLVGAIIAAVITVHHQNIKERCLLIEKWMNNLREEISRYLGFCERLFLAKSNKKFFDINITTNLTTSKYKVLLLLNDEPDQERLSELIKNIFQAILRHPDTVNDLPYGEYQFSVFNETRLLLDKHWRMINNDLKLFSIVRLLSQISEEVSRLFKRYTCTSK